MAEASHSRPLGDSVVSTILPTPDFPLYKYPLRLGGLRNGLDHEVGPRTTTHKDKLYGVHQAPNSGPPAHKATPLPTRAFLSAMVAFKFFP